MRITKLERHAEGYWTARVAIDGRTVAVDKRFGSWRITPPKGVAGYVAVLPHVGEALQARVRPLERKEAA